MSSKSAILEKEGRVWIRNALSEAELLMLDSACDLTDAPGARLSLDQEWGLLGAAEPLTQLARELLPQAKPVRLLAFNKTPALNWSVPWHQDRVIAVRERHEIEGYKAWSRKAGQWHVEPPLALLGGMFFARVHLDDTDASNGCLELALGSHRLGQVLAGEAETAARTCVIERCHARRGDVLFVKALTLHRSASSQNDSSRRTLRIDYSAAALPKPLQWDA